MNCKNIKTGWNGSLLLFAAAILSLLAGCATSTMPPPTKSAPATTAYIIGPGDQMMIYVRDNPDLSMTVPVRPDGKISIPLVQDMMAAGKTPAHLADDLEDALSKYIRQPLVTVVVKSFNGVYGDQIRVVGQATVPQSLPYRDGMTLLDVMIQVGGLTPLAAGNRAKLVRTVNGQEKTYGVNIQALLSGDIGDNVPMRPGDIIIIPKSLL